MVNKSSVNNKDSSSAGSSPTASSSTPSPDRDKGAAAQGFSAKPQPNPEVTPAEAAPVTPTPNAELAATIAELQGKVTAQLTTIAQLQTDLTAQVAQSQQLQASLEKAETAARQLATLNQTLISENTTLKTAAAAQPEPPAAKLTKSESGKLAHPAKPEVNSMMHPVFPNGTLPSGLTEKDIGWFD
jgi:hypothetical protein